MKVKKLDGAAAGVLDKGGAICAPPTSCGEPSAQPSHPQRMHHAAALLQARTVLSMLKIRLNTFLIETSFDERKKREITNESIAQMSNQSMAYIN